jgi:hypothetical protein
MVVSNAYATMASFSGNLGNNFGLFGAISAAVGVSQLGWYYF